jgi:hypothetical protein
MQTVVPPVHAPFFPLEVPEKWVLVLSIVGRVETEHGKPVVRQEQAGRLVMLTQSFEFKGAEFDARTKELVVKVKFEAPPKTGIYRYEIACKCNGYLGLDVASEVECVGSRALASVARAKLTRTAHTRSVAVRPKPEEKEAAPEPAAAAAAAEADAADQGGLLDGMVRACGGRRPLRAVAESVTRSPRV